MEYPICNTCGAAVVDTDKHRRWHDDVDRRMKKTVDDALRDVARQADLFRRAG
jgi:hypothetical protein